MDKTTIIYIVLFLFFSTIDAQESLDSLPDLPADQVEVIKNFKTTHRDLNPHLLSPKIREVEKETFNFDYFLQIPLVEFDPPKPKIRPLAYNKPLQKNIYDGFVDLSIGTPSSPAVAAGYHYNIEDWYEFGILADYKKTNDSEIEYRDIERTNALAFGSYQFNRTFTLNAKANYQGENRYLFALANSFTNEPQDSFLRTLDVIDIGSSIGIDWYAKAGILIELGVQFQQSDLDRFGINESKTSIIGSINKTFGDRVLFETNVRGDYYNFDIENNTLEINGHKLNSWRFDPALYYKSDKISLDVGASLITQN